MKMVVATLEKCHGHRPLLTGPDFGDARLLRDPTEEGTATEEASNDLGHPTNWDTGIKVDTTTKRHFAKDEHTNQRHPRSH